MKRIVASLTALAVLSLFSIEMAAEKKEKPAKPKYTISQVMKALHKGPLKEKITKGTASAEEKAKVLAMFESMALQKPPKGEMASWKKLTAAQIEAGQALVDDKAEAVDAFTKAINCKACHTPHKIYKNQQ